MSNKNKILSIRGDLYDSMAVAANRSGFVKEDGRPDIGRLVSEIFSFFRLETDDLKFVFRVPKIVAEDPQQLKLFLLAQVEKVAG